MILLFYILFLFFPFFEGNTTKFNDLPKDFLTNGDYKTWYLAVKTPEEAFESCKASSPMSQDNSWIFYVDGTFEFNHGEITETDCNEEGCCTDFVNIIGRWELTNGEAGLKITLLYEKENPDNNISDVLFDAQIKEITEDILLISQTDPSTGTEVMHEFRKR